MMKWRFTNLTDSDFDVYAGDREEMLNRLAARIKKTRTELDSLFAELQKY